jgi:hypothetical protein
VLAVVKWLDRWLNRDVADANKDDD